MDILQADEIAMKEAVDYLRRYSPLHSTWTGEQVERLLYTPIEWGQTLSCYDQKLRRPHAFLSWAWLNNEAAVGYASGTRRLSCGDFPKTSPEDEIWIVDMICPFGGVREFCYWARQVLSPLTQNGFHMLRITPEGQIRRMGWFPTLRDRQPKSLEEQF